MSCAQHNGALPSDSTAAPCGSWQLVRQEHYRVQHGDGGRVVHHASAANRATADVQARADKHRAMLVPPHGHGPRSGRPLPAAIPVSREPKGITQRHTIGVAPAAQQQQAI
jgi:hypothetical protein